MAKTKHTAIPYGFAIGLAACLAALSGSHWFIQLQDQHWSIIALAVFGSVCVSALVGVCAYLVGRGFGFVLIPVGLAFLLADSYQNGLGYQTMTSLTVSGEVEAAQSRLDQARADLATLPMPNATGAIRKASTWETVNTTLTGRVEAAQAELTALTTPKANDTHVMAAMALIQIALSVLFGCLGRGAKLKPEAVQAEQEVEASDNVVRFVRTARMDEKDMRTWAKLTSK